MAVSEPIGTFAKLIPTVPLNDNLHVLLRLKFFRKRLATLFSSTLQDEEQIFFAQLLEMLNEGLPTDELFGTAEATAACQAMSEQNELLLSEGIVYKI